MTSTLPVLAATQARGPSGHCLYDRGGGGRGDFLEFGLALRLMLGSFFVSLTASNSKPMRLSALFSGSTN